MRLPSCARVIAFGLDLVLVMGASGALRDAIRRTTSAPPRQVTRRGPAQKRASAASSQHSNARFAEECQSILSNMIALFSRAIFRILLPEGRRIGCPLRFRDRAEAFGLVRKWYDARRIKMEPGP